MRLSAWTTKATVILSADSFPKKRQSDFWKCGKTRTGEMFLVERVRNYPVII